MSPTLEDPQGSKSSGPGVRARVAAKPRSPWLLASGLLVPLLMACTSNTSDSVAPTVEYQACGLCFESPVRLTRMRGVAIDSCVFGFKGQDLEVRGSHDGGSEEGQPPRERKSGADFESLRLAATSVRPEASLEVQFARAEQREVAIRIAESLYRCGMPFNP
ncbi:MAG: hypothetical protein R3B07_28505 [Polyangiaceae bacterium]